MPYDAIDIYSREDLIMKIHLTVNYASAIGAEGTLMLAFEHTIEGCMDDSVDDCSEVSLFLHEDGQKI